MNKKSISIIAAVIFFFAYEIVIGAPLPSYNQIEISVANDAGTRFDYSGRDTYYINFTGGGLNALHIASTPSDRAGADLATASSSGTFYVTDSGGKKYDSEIILLVSIVAPSQGGIPSDLSFTISASGYQLVMNGSTDTVLDRTYVSPSLSEEFFVSDFIYGAQLWKPSSAANQPLWISEDMLDSNNNSMLMFIDLNVGIDSQGTGLIDEGQARVDFSIQNPQRAALEIMVNAYGYRENVGAIGWSNQTSGAGSSGLKIIIPAEDSIPTLSEWGLLILAVSLLSTLVWLMSREPLPDHMSS